ncbi:hypothetical protein [Nocardiopsis coralliicola]
MHSEPSLARVPGTGAHALMTGADSGVVRSASGRFLQLHSPPPDLPEALRGAAVASEESAAYASRLRSAMAEREHGDAQRRWPAPRRRAAVVGAGPPADAVAETLSTWEVAVERHSDGAALLHAWDRAPGRAGPPLVIAYADTPDQRAGWDRIDRAAHGGTAWLRAYREGETCFVDPLTAAAQDPGAGQVLRRRLAASPAPEAMDTWRRAAAAAPPLSGAAHLLLTARILTVALAWARDEDGLEAYRRTLWKLVPATGAITEHTVLAYDPPHIPEPPE